MKKFHEILYKNRAKRYSILTIIVGVFLYNKPDCPGGAAYNYLGSGYTQGITHS